MQAEAGELFRIYGAVEELLLSEELEAHLLERGTYDKHNVSLLEIVEVHQNAPKYFANKGPEGGSERSAENNAPIVLVGPTFNGRMVAVPIDPAGEGTWRPRTAFEANTHHKEKYAEGGT